jgi:hypothetical protein
MWGYLVLEKVMFWIAEGCWQLRWEGAGAAGAGGGVGALGPAHGQGRSSQ